MILGVVVIALVLSLAYPIQEYIAQRGEIAALEQQRREAEARVEALEERRRQLVDPAYVEQLARQRLNYAMPGDRIFVVVDAEGEPAADAVPVVETTAVPDDGDSWLERLGESVRRADAG